MNHLRRLGKEKVHFTVFLCVSLYVHQFNINTKKKKFDIFVHVYSIFQQRRRTQIIFEYESICFVGGNLAPFQFHSATKSKKHV